ncbi:MAG: Phytanoyl-CoA dioxygenase [Betaproteobacteria bacterium]|nr:Phytanoyl-CoA dioxygenase [Betaproteobacteria bacterium]
MTMLSFLGLGQRKKRWKHKLKDAPWFDRPDAFELLDERRRQEGLSDEDYALLQKWVADGYCVVSGVVDERKIDEMTRDMDEIWTAREPLAGLRILDTKLDSQNPLNLSHAEVLALEISKRLEIRDASRWRVHGFYLHSANARAVFDNPQLNRLASLILGRPAAPRFTINFMYGSEQELHQDTAVFHVAPRNYLVGAWLACEDVSPDAGPLVFYPGSHREPLYPKFDNYPQTNLRTYPRPQEYSEYVARRSEHYERRLYLARKGDVFFWHGMLIHGGSSVTDPKRTRRSYVCHYIPGEMEVSSRIEGPFNW